MFLAVHQQDEREGPWLRQPLRAAWPRESPPRHHRAETFCTCFIIFYSFLSSFSWKVSVSFTQPTRLYSRPSRPVTWGASATPHGLCRWLGTGELRVQQGRGSGRRRRGCPAELAGRASSSDDVPAVAGARAAPVTEALDVNVI